LPQPAGVGYPPLMATAEPLPIDDVLDDVRAHLRERTRLVISAPPGAGKTTRTPLALLEDEWTSAGRQLLVVPRRIAARAAAERLAASLGEPVGRTVGLRSRLDVRTSPDARIEVVTEGVFARMILEDPGLQGVSAVLFDEVHERSLDGEEGLALALDAQAVVRDDLRIVLMSATLPPDLTREFFDGPVVHSDGRAWAVDTVYVGYDAGRRIEDQTTDAIDRALRETMGSILVFLPGAGEIRRTADRLERRLLPGDAEVRMLYGALEPREQAAAIAPPPPGVRKIVLATDVAESSLTIEGVNVVIDAGFARVPRFEPALGASRLETVRVAIANADQRRGRAGRTGPGVCYRLWREAEMAGFRRAPAPEIENADLAGLRLDLARWGVRDAGALRWMTPPPAAAWRAATAALRRLGALDAAGALTSLGARLGELPLSPRLAGMVLAASPADRLLAAEIAAVLSERELGGRSTDLGDRLHRLRSASDQRSRVMRSAARRWSQTAADDAGGSAGALLAAAFPERIARARPGARGRYLLAGGRGAVLDESDPLANEPWLAVAEVTGGGPDLRITLAAPLTESEALACRDVEVETIATYDVRAAAVRARRTRRLGAILIDETPLPEPPDEIAAAALCAAVREQGWDALPDPAPLRAAIERVNFLRAACGEPWPADLSADLRDRLEDWLAPMARGARPLAGASGEVVANAALLILDWTLQRDLDRLAPATWLAPVGRRIPIDYSDPGRPTVALKLQEVFGLNEHPRLAAGAVPLALHLLSPAMRPIAVTQDIAGFWRTGYSDVRKDLRGRYPKHAWPDDPLSAAPTSRAKPRA
jgi:ATP-dependent helicase HrpB